MPDIVETFAEYFSSVGESDPPEPTLADHVTNSTDTQFIIPEMTEEQVRAGLKSLDRNKATGTDGLSTKLLHLCGESLVLPLLFIFNLSIRTHTFPVAWKEAKVSPIFKKGDPTDPCNYRPIAVLSTISKILERHIANSLRCHLEDNALLAENQSGFRPRDFTSTMVDV